MLCKQGVGKYAGIYLPTEPIETDSVKPWQDLQAEEYKPMQISLCKF